MVGIAVLIKKNEVLRQSFQKIVQIKIVKFNVLKKQSIKLLHNIMIEEKY